MESKKNKPLNKAVEEDETGKTSGDGLKLWFDRWLGRWCGLLEVSSFICGAAVMVLEMAGSRVVAPYMGTSLVVWTSLIGVIMASLSLGYWLGGVAADLRPEQKILARIVLLSAFSTGFLALCANPVLTLLSRIHNPYISSILAALLLFALPSLLLGMVSPFIVRLAMKDVGSSGETVGRFSALSSAGSILGTFLGGFVLISVFASGTILLLVAATLAFVASMLYRSAWKKAALICVAFLMTGIGTEVWGMPMMPLGDHIDTRYNHIWVAEQTRPNGRRARYLMTAAAREGAQSIIYTDNPSELASEYTKFYDLAFYYNPGVKKILMLGGGGYCVPRYLVATRSDDLRLPTFSMDVVEIDPGITSAARKYFYLQDSPALSIYHEDARSFLNRAARDPQRRGSYDAVFADVFGSWYSIPFHLTTVETAQAMSDLLTPDGVLVSNVISALYGPRSGVLHGIYSALSKVFPRVLIFPAQNANRAFVQQRQNIMVVAFKSENDLPVLPPYSPEIARLLSHRWSEPFISTVSPFTDAFAPVESYALRD
ncbi:MAG: fused MFS/spermidine synthase [Synergistaceae bacterium]|jgi:spermidine synthase|nr:fused MFS/spermidine synthase [Synergistaceae bacterium]